MNTNKLVLQVLKEATASIHKEESTTSKGKSIYLESYSTYETKRKIMDYWIQNVIEFYLHIGYNFCIFQISVSFICLLTLYTIENQ